MLSTVIIVFIVVVFLATFVIPLARRKSEEGFADTEDGGYRSYMGGYLADRKKMIDAGNQQYNNLGISLDPLLATFAVAPADIEDNPNLSPAQYLKQFNALTNAANNKIKQSLANPDIDANTVSPTNMSPMRGGKVREELPPPNDILLTARQCETKIRTRQSCGMLDDPAYAKCGVCIDGGTRFNGENANTFIGGLLSLVQDRVAAEDSAGNGKPLYTPSLGKCPPGMFYVDSASCQKAVNQLNCKEIGNSGGFQGGKTKEGLTTSNVSCAQAPVPNVYLYQPANKPYDIVLRFLAPFGTGLNAAIVTHVPSGRTFKGEGKAGQEFTVTLRGVKEQDPVTVMVVQEMPHRIHGQAEVFQVLHQSGNGHITSMKKDNASDICQRIGAQLATYSQIADYTNSGGQSGYCGRYANNTDSIYSFQTGKAGFGTIGQNPETGPCNAKMEKAGVGAWCYGMKPSRTSNYYSNGANTNILGTSVNWFFESFGGGSGQGSSIFTQYMTPNTDAPPGEQRRAITIQWEMPGTQNRTVSFQPTITGVNQPRNTKTLRIYGPFAKSSQINGPAWNSSMNMQKNQFWLWSNIATSQTATFMALVPGYLHDPYYSDDIQNAPMGPLINNPATVELLKTSPCFAEGQAPGSYSAACLLTLFQGVGGDPTKGKFATENGGLTQLNNLGDLDAISDHLLDLATTAVTGKDGNGNVISMNMNSRMAAMNSAAQQLFGFNIINPCEDIVDNADGSVGLVPKPMGSVSADCLQYLWLNNLSDADREPGKGSSQMYANTYTSIADRFSGLRYSESTPNRRDQYPFQACQTGGSMAPIKDGKPDKAIVSQLTNMGSLQAVQDYFNSIQKTANYGTDQKEQATAMKQCYGIKQAKSTQLGYGCTLILPPQVVPGVTCYINLGDPAEITNYLTYSNGSAFFGGVQNSPNITFYLDKALNGQAGCITFKTGGETTLVLRHSGWRIQAKPFDGSRLMAADASWKVIPSLNNDSTMVSFQSVNYPDHYFSQAGGPNEVWNTVYAGTPTDANLKSFAVVGVPGITLPPAAPICNPAPCDPKCPKGGEGITSINTSGGYNIRLYTQAECGKLGGNWAAVGKSWGMSNNSVGECLGTPGGNIGFCNNTPGSAPSSAAAAAVGQ